MFRKLKNLLNSILLAVSVILSTNAFAMNCGSVPDPNAVEWRIDVNHLIFSMAGKVLVRASMKVIRSEANLTYAYAKRLDTSFENLRSQQEKSQLKPQEQVIWDRTQELVRVLSELEKEVSPSLQTLSEETGLSLSNLAQLLSARGYGRLNGITSSDNIATALNEDFQTLLKAQQRGLMQSLVRRWNGSNERHLKELVAVEDQFAVYWGEVREILQRTNPAYRPEDLLRMAVESLTIPH